MSDSEELHGLDPAAVESGAASAVAEITALETPPPADEPEPEPDEPSRAEAPGEDERVAPGPGSALTDDELLASVTALVFASPDPLSLPRLCKLLEGPEPARVRTALESLRERLARSGLPIELRSIAAGWQLLTAPALGDVVARLFQSAKVERISPAALETLAIVAYRQPVTKAEVEAIRGVQAGPLLRTLVDRGLIRVTGRSDQPGHALQYGTTRSFLDRFCLESLDDLPRDGELSD